MSKERTSPLPKPRVTKTSSSRNAQQPIQIHVLDESLTEASTKGPESQQREADAGDTVTDTGSDQKDSKTVVPSEKKHKLPIYFLDESTRDPAERVHDHAELVDEAAHLQTSTTGADHMQINNRGDLDSGKNVNVSSRDSTGVEPYTVGISVGRDEKGSDNASLNTGKGDSISDQEKTDKGRNRQPDDDQGYIDCGSAPQLRKSPQQKIDKSNEGYTLVYQSRKSLREKTEFFKSQIDKQVSEAVPEEVFRPRTKTSRTQTNPGKTDNGQNRKTDDIESIDSGPASKPTEWRQRPQKVDQRDKGVADLSRRPLKERQEFFKSQIDKQASDVVDLQASDIVQRPKRQGGGSLRKSVNIFESKIEASNRQEHDSKQQAEVFVQSKRVSTDNKVARYEREGDLLCETKEAYAATSKIWMSESGNHMSEEMKTYMKKSNAMVTVAIDFGTTYSGCAYSMRDNPGKIYILNFKEGLSPKTPTAILYDQHGKRHSFGYQALEHYAGLSSADERYIWRLFERFKMKLFTRNETISRDVQITDNHGNKKLALDIFADALRYMAEHITKQIYERVPDFDDDIHWVITVPAIWSTISRTFMRVAAQKAGISNERLSLALEPEAAAILCKCESSLQLQPGKRFMIVDIGGGTTDIAVCEVNEDTSLKELHQPSGGDFGGINVDEQFIELFIEIFGEDVLTEFKDKHTKLYMEMMTDFEYKKRLFDGTNKCKIKVDPLLLTLYSKVNGRDVVSLLQESPLLTKRVIWKYGQLILCTETVKDFFDVVIEKILAAIKIITAKVDRIDSIVLVGGFSESPYLRSRLEKAFPGKIPKVEDPVLAVIKGAVLIGRDPYAIASRVCEYTYGVAGTMKFKSHHPKQYRFYVDGVAMCDNCFYKHIEIGTEVSVHDEQHAVEHEYFPSTIDQKHAILEVYASTERNPEYIDHTCHLVGFIKVDIDPRGDFWSKILVKMVFGGTEIKVVITDVKNGDVQRGSVDFWG